MSHVSKSLRSLTKNERCEQIAQVAHQKWEKWATMSDSRKLLTNNERIAQVANFFAKKEQFTQKTYEWISSPAFYVKEQAQKSMKFKF